MTQAFIDKVQELDLQIKQAKATHKGTKLLEKRREKLVGTCDHAYPDGRTANVGTFWSHTCHICGFVD